MSSGPRRIVCLSAETADVLYRLHAGDLVVGVSGYTTVPREARQKPIVSAFTTIRYEVIEALQPDLILSVSTVIDGGAVTQFDGTEGCTAGCVLWKLPDPWTG